MGTPTFGGGGVKREREMNVGWYGAEMPAETSLVFFEQCARDRQAVLQGVERAYAQGLKSDEMQAAIAQGADYIGVGPVYATPTKIKAAAGLEYVRYAAQQATLPWFAIGGIDSDNLADVLQAGANQVAVVRAIMQSNDPTQSVKNLLQQLAT